MCDSKPSTDESLRPAIDSQRRDEVSSGDQREPATVLARAAHLTDELDGAGREAMVYRRDRVVWGAVLFRTTNPEVVEGAIVRRSERLHWTSQAAKEEVLGWIRGLSQTNAADEIDWQSAEDVAIGRFANDPNHVAVIRSILLPLGRPPRIN